MQKILLSIFISMAIMMTIIQSSFAQTFIPEILILEPPQIINFTQKANWQIAHPKKKHKRFIRQSEDLEEDFHFQPGPLTGEINNFIVEIPEGVRAVSPAPNIVFNGTLDNGSLIPPDINGAVGINYVVETNNQQIDIFNKNGTLQSTLNINNFFSPSGGSGYFDPHVLYDANHNRFIIIIACDLSNGHGGIVIAVSQNSDPTGNWYIYTLDDGINNSSTTLLDYPLLGYNNKWIVVTANLFQGNNVTTKIFVVNRATMYSGSAGSMSLFSDPGVFSLCPASTNDTITSTEYMVADWWGDSTNNGYIRTYTITGPVGSPVYAPGYFIGVNQPWDENSVGAPQSGTGNTLEDGDTRISNAVYQNGSLWFAHTVYLPAGNPTYDAVQWWQINPSTPSVQQFGRITQGAGGNFYIYPSIALNSYGDALVGYTVTSSSIHPSAQYSMRLSSDPLNTMEDGYLYKAGLATYYKTFGGGRNRWGDYSGTAVDPVDNSFWTIQEFANSPANNWGTTVANIGGTPCSGTPAAGTISSLDDTVCVGEGTTLDLTGYSTGVLGLTFQWQQSANGINGWANASGSSTNVSYSTQALAGTTYFHCVVTCVNSTLTSTSPVFAVYTPGILSAPGDTVCSPGTYTLTATGIGTTHWYVNAVTPVVLATGNSITVTVTGDSTFYAGSGSNTSYNVGPATNAIGGGGQYNTYAGRGEYFHAYSDFTLDTVFIYPGSAGNVTINMADSASGTIIHTITVAIGAAAINVKTPVALNWSVAGGAAYQIHPNGTTLTGLYRNNSGAVFPYSIPGVVSITRTINVTTGYYYFFYDWQLHNGCASPRVPVTIHVGSSTITASASSNNICSGASTTLTASGASSYNWMPGNLNGSSVTVSPTTTTTYTVTGTIGVGCSATATVIITVGNSLTVTASSSVDSICNGSSVTLTASGATTYNWMPGNLNGASVIVSPTSTTTYTVTGTGASGCSASATKTIIVHAIPSVSSSATSTNICAGNSTTLSATGAATYLWQPGNHNGSSFTVSPIVTTTYTVTGTTLGCSATSTIIISVGSAVTVTTTTTADSICVGNSATLTASGASTYLWQPGNLNGTSVIVSPIITTTYTVTGTSAAGCSATANRTIIVHSSPIVSATATTTSICIGGSTTLTATGASSYVWQPGNLNGTSVIVSPLTTTTYTVTGTSSGCSAASFIVITVGSSITVIASASDDSVCVGNSTTLTGSGAATYVWQPGNISGAVINVTPLSTTTYTVTGTAAAGCSNTTTIVIAVVSSPSVNANATSNSICTGASTTLNASGASTYNWMPGNLNGSSVSVSPTSSTTYTVTGSIGAGCSATATVAITVNNVPSVSATSSSPIICNGSSATLTASGASTYVWMPGNINGNGISVSPTANITYTVTGTSAAGCSATATVTVNVNLVPTVSATTTADSICAGHSTTLEATGASSYLWQPGNLGGASVSVSPIATTTYTLSGTSLGCTGTATVVITIVPGPVISASSTASIICSGNSVTLSATGASTYQWQPGAMSGTSVLVSPSVNTTYTVEGTDALGCSTSATVSIAIDVVNISANSTNDSMCVGNSVSLSALGASTYLWQPGALSGSTVSVSPSVNTTYTVIGTDALSCTNVTTVTIFVDVVNVTASITSGADTICRGDAVSIAASGATNYSWQPGGTSGSTLTASPNNTTTYTVTGSDAFGCSITSSVTVYVDLCSGINSVLNNEFVEVFPDPVKDQLTIVLNDLPMGNCIIELFNVLGQKVISLDQQTGGTQTIVPMNVSLLPAGIYVLRIQLNEKQWLNKINKF